MTDEQDAHVFNAFMLVPHIGLARIEGALESLGVEREMRFWRKVGNDEFPRVEYQKASTPYTLSMGVSRMPFEGFISWVAIQHVHANLDRSAAARLMYRESEKNWSRSWSKGTVNDQDIDALVQTWSLQAELEQKLEQDTLIYSTLTSFVAIIMK